MNNWFTTNESIISTSNINKIKNSIPRINLIIGRTIGRTLGDREGGGGVLVP